jgi:tRNA dimethylallyltransferase
MNNIKLIIILGPTAVGKTELSMELALKYNAEIISSDAMMVYKLLDIGTNKPTKEIRDKIKHYLLDVVYPNEDFTAKDFQKESDKAIVEIKEKSKNIILVGGSGFYIKALVNGLFEIKDNENLLKIRNELLSQLKEKNIEYLYSKLKEIDPDKAKELHANDWYRITRALEVYYLTGNKISSAQKKHNFSEKRFLTLKIGLRNAREKIYSNIDKRVHDMLDRGLLDEIKHVLSLGYDKNLKPFKSLGYKYFINYLSNNLSLDEAINLTKRDTRHFAKRQFTYFNADNEVNWVEMHEKERIKMLVENFVHKD